MKKALLIFMALLLALLPAAPLAEDEALTQAEAVYGTPVVDGNADDEIWRKAAAYTVGSGETSGQFKAVWDDNALYLLAVVDDTTLDKSSSAIYQQDSIELFLDELNNKSNNYNDDDVHYRVNYDNERSVDNGEAPRWYTKTTLRYDGEGNAIGYIVEACFQWNKGTPANDAVMGFDVQINVCSGGSRQSAPALFDKTGNAYQNTALFGEIRLKGKGENDQTPAYPYGLLYYIEEVEGRNLSVFKNPEIVDEPLANGKTIAGSGNATQEQIDAAYRAIAEALKQLDDGSGMPNAEALPDLNGIPDMMKFNDGSDVVTAADWAKRREEIMEYYQYYMYGYMPDKSQETVTYAIKDNIQNGEDKGGKILEITVEANGKSATFDVLFTLPDPATNPAPQDGYPYFIEYAGYKMNFWGMEWYTGPSSNQTFAANRGYAGVAYDPTAVASDSDARTGAFYELYPYGDDYKSQNGSLLGWAWGVGKIIDALEAGAATELNINPEYSLVGGVSRYGKGAAVAGAYEKRIKVVIPSCSGAGGLAIYRTNNSGKKYDLSMVGGAKEWVNDSANEPLSNLQGGESYWFCGNFAKIPGVEAIPVDQHMLAAMVADPNRHMIIVTGMTSEGWNNTEGQALAYVASQEAWELLGCGDHNNMIIHEDGHAILTSDMQYILDYCDVHLYGKDPSEVKSDLTKMKGNLFLEGNRDVLYDEFEPYLYSVTSITADAAVAYGADVTVNIETSIPVKRPIADGEMTLVAQLVENATGKPVDSWQLPVPGIAEKGYKTSISWQVYSDQIDAKDAEHYSLAVCLAEGPADCAVVTTKDVLKIEITPLEKIFYLLFQNGPAIGRTREMTFAVRIVGKHLLESEKVLSFVGSMSSGGNSTVIPGASITFTADGEDSVTINRSLPSEAEDGASIRYYCAAEELEAKFNIVVVDMVSQAPELNAREFGGSRLSSVTGSSTMICTVQKTNNVALRSAPAVAANTFLTWLPRNAEVIVYGTTEGGAWAYVSTSDMSTKGYVQTKYLKEQGARLEVGDTWADAPHYDGLADIKERTYVYAAPSTSAAKVDYLSQGDKVSITMLITAEDNKNVEWLLIRTESGIVGYIPNAKARQTLSAGATVYSFNAGATVYVHGTKSLRLRAEPNGAFIDWLTEGTAVTVIQDQGNGWVKVSSDKGEGYVMSRYLDSRKALESGDAMIEVIGEVQAGYFEAGSIAVVNSSNELNYRNGPGYNFDKLNTYGNGIKSGTCVTVVSDNGYGWVKIIHPDTGEQVWVSRSFLAKP